VSKNTRLNPSASDVQALKSLNNDGSQKAQAIYFVALFEEVTVIAQVTTKRKMQVK